MAEQNENIVGDFIEWKKEYETGIVVIDGQHRNLVDIINKLEHAHNQKSENEVLRETIIKLVEYTKVHFGYEENHMAESAYHNLSDHKEKHKLLVDQVIEILNHIKQGEYKNMSDDILNFLKEWLLNHILVEDKEYAKYYRVKKRYM